MYTYMYVYIYIIFLYYIIIVLHYPLLKCVCLHGYRHLTAYVQPEKTLKYWYSLRGCQCCTSPKIRVYAKTQSNNWKKVSLPSGNVCRKCIQFS